MATIEVGALGIVGGSIGGSVWGSTWGSILGIDFGRRFGDRLGDQLGDHFGDQVWESILVVDAGFKSGINLGINVVATATPAIGAIGDLGNMFRGLHWGSASPGIWDRLRDLEGDCMGGSISGITRGS